MPISLVIYFPFDPQLFSPAFTHAAIWSVNIHQHTNTTIRNASTGKLLTFFSCDLFTCFLFLTWRFTRQVTTGQKQTINKPCVEPSASNTNKRNGAEEGRCLMSWEHEQSFSHVTLSRAMRTGEALGGGDQFWWRSMSNFNVTGCILSVSLKKT